MQVAGTITGRWCTPAQGAPARVHSHAFGSEALIDVGGVVLLRLAADGSVSPVVAGITPRSGARWTRRSADEVELDGRFDAGCAFGHAVVRFGPDAQASIASERVAVERALVAIDDALARGSTSQAEATAASLELDAQGLLGARIAAARVEVALDAGSERSAATLLADVLERLDRLVPPSHPAALHASAMQAALLRLRGAPDASREARERLAAAYAHSASADVADRLANQVELAAMLTDDFGDEAAARRLAEQAAEDGRAALGEVAPVTLRAELLLARVASNRLDRVARLATLHQHVVTTYGAEAPVAAAVLFGYAVASERTGNLQAAHAALERAHAVRARTLGDDHPRTVALLDYLAYVRGALNRFDDAVAVQRIVLERYRRLYGDDHPRSVLAAQNLGSWLLALDRSGEALPLHTAAHASMQRRFGPAHWRTLDALLDRAEALLALGDTAAACERFTEVASVARTDALVEQYAKARFGEGRCALAASRPRDAVEAFGEVRRLRATRFGEAAEPTLSALAALARARLEAGDRSGAAEALQDLVDRSEALRTSEAPQSGGGRASFARRVAGTRELAGYRDLAWLRAAAGETRAAIAVAELARGRDVAEALQLHAIGADGGLPQRARVALVRTAETLRDTDAALAVTPVASAEYSDLSRQRDSLAAEVERLRSTLDRSRGHPTSPGVDEVMRRLRNDVAIVGVQASHAGTWVYALRRGQPIRSAVVDEGTTLQSQAAVLREALALPPLPFPILWRLADRRFTVALARPDARATPVTAEALANEIGAVLLRPLAATLRGVSGVIVVADGAFSALPVDIIDLAAVTGSSRIETTHAPSLAAIASLQQRGRDAARPRGLIAIGAPDYTRLGSRGPGPLDGLAWPALPGARRELAELRAALSGGRFIEGRDATRATLLRLNRSGELGRARLIHVAAHGYLSAAAPQWSSLVLGSEDGLGPGYVTAAELATFDLDADLVTLSACETGLGRDVAGEGVYGLPYALAVAGARATLLSLWRVDDASTAEFMRRFYRRLARGERPASALAAVKQDMRREPRWRAPFHWAPFALFGA